MRLALEQAEAAAATGEVPVGAVITLGGEVIAAAHNAPIGNHDPSAHAEIMALRSAGKAAGNYRLVDATLYVTLEPCVMCVGALAHARIRRLVFGAYDPKAGALGSVIDLSACQAFNHRFEVQGGVLADECLSPLREFFASRRNEADSLSG